MANSPSQGSISLFKNLLMYNISAQWKNMPLLVISISLFSMSCSKDMDLLAEAVTQNVENFAYNEAVLVNDTYKVYGSNSIIMDVLDNDVIENKDDIKIIDITQPTNGEVSINDDNTLTYIPVKEENQQTDSEGDVILDNSGNEEEKNEILEVEELDSHNNENENTVEDSFTYTVESTDQNGNKETAEGTVNIHFDKTYGALKAFPSAEGFGKYATGGRGGRIIEVTNLNNSGEGSLRAALAETGTRTIIFKVSGTIECTSYLQIKHGNGNVTIAGQTAPGDGIAIKGAELRIMASNVIVRHLRIRPGEETTGSNEDGLRVVAYKNTRVENVIIDTAV